MKNCFAIYVFSISFVSCDASFFFLKEKLFCKICPTYCPVRHHHKRDIGAASLTHINNYSPHSQLPELGHINYRYDDMGHKSYAYDDIGHKSSTGYDNLGQQVPAYGDLGHSHYVYDNSGYRPPTALLAPESHDGWVHKQPTAHDDVEHSPLSPTAHAAYKDSVKKYQYWDHSEQKPYEYLYATHHKQPWSSDHHETQHEHPFLGKQGYEVEYNVKYVFKPVTTNSATTTKATTRSHPWYSPHTASSTTETPKTTTEEPSGICMFCMNHCHWPYSFYWY